MRADSKYPWYVFDVVIFIVVNIFALWWIKPGLNVIDNFPPFIIVLLGLAVFRGADIVSNEPVLAPLREPFVRHIHQHGKEIERPWRFGFRGAMGSLLYCPSCTGVWVAMALVYGYLIFPRVVIIVVVILAVSALERFLTSFYNIEKSEVRKIG